MYARLFYFKQYQRTLKQQKSKDEPARKEVNTMADNEEKNVYEEISEENEKNVEPSEEVNEEEEEIVEDKPSEEPLLTKEDVEEMGLGKGFIGKPVSILKDVYKNQDKLYRQTSQTLSEMKTEIAELKGSLSKKEVKEAQKTAEQEAEDELGEMPDPVNDFDDYKLWMAKKDKLTTENFRKILREELSNVSKSTEELQQDKNNQILWDNLVTGLKEVYGEDLTQDNVNAVLKEYNDSLQELEKDEFDDEIKRYTGRPVSLAKNIIKYHKSNLFGKKEETDEEKKARIKAAQDKKVNQLKKTNKEFTSSATSPRKKADSGSEDNIYKEIADENEIIIKREGGE